MLRVRRRARTRRSVRTSFKSSLGGLPACDSSARSAALASIELARTGWRRLAPRRTSVKEILLPGRQTREPSIANRATGIGAGHRRAGAVRSGHAGARGSRDRTQRLRLPLMLWPRWIWLRALGCIFLSTFYSLAFQITALNGPRGVLPAAEYLQAVQEVYGARAIWFSPTLFWLGSSDFALTAVTLAGAAAALLLILNLAPRISLAVAFVCFLSFIAGAQDFASYQSDGMLLEAGFISLFLAPGGLRPGLGEDDPPSRLPLFLLLWEWFRIYFESGLVKILSGDPQWASLTAMDHYYENGPLPSWIGWYVQQRLPHAFHAFTTVAVFMFELVVVWLALDGVPVPLQAAGSDAGAWHLRTIPAAVRMEPLVRLARRVARVRVGRQRRAASARRLAAGPAPLRARSIRRAAARLYPRREVAVLVHHARGEAQDFGVVAAAGARSLRTHPEARTRGDPGRRPAAGVK